MTRKRQRYIQKIPDKQQSKKQEQQETHALNSTKSKAATADPQLITTLIGCWAQLTPSQKILASLIVLTCLGIIGTTVYQYAPFFKNSSEQSTAFYKELCLLLPPPKLSENHIQQLIAAKATISSNIIGNSATNPKQKFTRLWLQARNHSQLMAALLDTFLSSNTAKIELFPNIKDHAAINRITSSAAYIINSDTLIINSAYHPEVIIEKIRHEGTHAGLFHLFGKEELQKVTSKQAGMFTTPFAASNIKAKIFVEQALKNGKNNLMQLKARLQKGLLSLDDIERYHSLFADYMFKIKITLPKTLSSNLQLKKEYLATDIGLSPQKNFKTVKIVALDNIENFISLQLVPTNQTKIERLNFLIEYFEKLEQHRKNTYAETSQTAEELAELFALFPETFMKEFYPELYTYLANCLLSPEDKTPTAAIDI